MVSLKPLAELLGGTKEPWFHRLACGGFARQPGRTEVGVRKPLDRLHQRIERTRHEGEVDLPNLITHAMVIGVQTKTRNRVSNHATQCERVVVGTLKEILLRMRISNKRRTLTREFRTECRSLKASQPQCTGSHLRIRPAKHFKSDIRNYLLERHGRMRDEVLRSKTTTLFTPEADKVDRALRSFS